MLGLKTVFIGIRESVFWKKNVYKWISVVVIFLMIVTSVLYIIDPVNIYGSKIIKGLNHYKIKENLFFDISKPYQYEKLKPKEVIIGSSRVYVGLNPFKNDDMYKYLAELDKNSIRVVDGDTIKYKDNYYRFIGLDAPELKQNYGTNVKAYVENKIKNASNVRMLVGSYDIFGRILCHLFIDDVPLAYPMMKDKQAKETIMKYGDNGFTTIASNIVYLSKHQGRRPFTDPAKFREEN